MFAPEALVAIEPVGGGAHRFGLEAAGDGAAGFLALDETGVRQDVEMLHDRGQRHREGLRQLAHRQAFLVLKPRQQRAPRRIGKRRKSAIEPLVLILNHVV